MESKTRRSISSRARVLVSNISRLMAAASMPVSIMHAAMRYVRGVAFVYLKHPVSVVMPV